MESVRQNQDLETLQYLRQPEEIFLVLYDLIFTNRQDRADGSKPEPPGIGEG